jgi:hypothetical protein
MLKLMIVCGKVAHAQPARVIVQIVQTVIETESKVEFQSWGFGPLLIGTIWLTEPSCFVFAITFRQKEILLMR